MSVFLWINPHKMKIFLILISQIKANLLVGHKGKVRDVVPCFCGIQTLSRHRGGIKQGRISWINSNQTYVIVRHACVVGMPGGTSIKTSVDPTLRSEIKILTVLRIYDNVLYVLIWVDTICRLGPGVSVVYTLVDIRCRGGVGNVWIDRVENDIIGRLPDSCVNPTQP